MTALCLVALLAAQIDGKLIHSVTKKPIPRVSVQVLEHDDSRRVADTTSDTEGAFQFKDLPAGRYKLSTQHSRYAPINFSGVLDLKAETKIEGISLKLSPASAITGRVVDSDGDPLQNVQITTYRAAPFYTEDYWLPTGGAQTDDRGAFRIANVPPGQYLLACKKHESAYRMTYYPNAASAADAQPLLVVSGEDRNELVLTMPVQKSGVIRGTFSVPGRAWIMTEAALHERRVPFQENVSSPIDPRTGAFEIRGLNPGEYRFVVLSSGMGQSSRILATGEANFSGQDIENLTLQPVEPASLSGKVIYEGVGKPSVRVGLLFPELGRNTFQPVVTPTGESGEFTLSNIVPDRYRVLVDLGKSKAFVKSIRQGDHELLGQFFDISSRAQDPMTILISTKVATLSGKVERADSSAPPGVIVVEPLDHKPEIRLILGGSNTLPSFDQEGNYEVPNLAPGKYRVYAFEGIRYNDAFDSALLKRFAKQATELTLAEGESRILGLKQITAAQVEEAMKQP